MFKAIEIRHPADIELLGGVPSIRGHGKVVPSILGQKYALSWKTMSRDEGLELMRDHHLFANDFITARNRYNGNYEYDFNEVYFSNTVYILPAAKKPNGKPTPIRLWKPRGYLDWIQERVNIIVDHWAGANNGIGWDNWVNCIKKSSISFMLRQATYIKKIGRQELTAHYREMFIAQSAVPNWWPLQRRDLRAGFSVARLKPFALAMSKKHFSAEDVQLLSHFRYTSKPELSRAWMTYRLGTTPYQVITQHHHQH